MTFIYGLVDPRTEELRYIGKSTNLPERMSRHIRKAKAGCIRHCRRWIAGLLAEGFMPDIFVLEVTHEHLANDAEIFWIASMRLAGCRLTNRTDGGDGQSKGYSASPESRLRQSMAERARGGWSVAHRAAHAAALARPETRAKMSAARKGKPLPLETVEKARLAKLGKRPAQYILEAMWNGNRGRKQSAEEIAKRMAWRKRA